MVNGDAQAEILGSLVANFAAESGCIKCPSMSAGIGNCMCCIKDTAVVRTQIAIESWIRILPPPELTKRLEIFLPHVEQGMVILGPYEICQP